MNAYDELLARLKDIDLVSQIGGLLGWDQEVLMPPKHTSVGTNERHAGCLSGHISLDVALPLAFSTTVCK